jgi:hypothetical protein
MNKQKYNELNLIISYVALLVSNGDWKPPRMGTYFIPIVAIWLSGLRNNYLFTTCFSFWSLLHTDFLQSWTIGQTGRICFSATQIWVITIVMGTYSAN